LRAPRYPKEQTVTDRSQAMTPFIKVIIATDEEAFLELPPILNAYLKPAIMQLNTDETAVELFFLQPEDARALVAALGKLTPPIGAEILDESVIIPMGRGLPLTHPYPIGAPVKVPATNRSQLDVGEIKAAKAGQIGGWNYTVRWPDGSEAEYPMEQVIAQ
jgi:hypothetical protein